jgi:hypothetical protein
MTERVEGEPVPAYVEQLVLAAIRDNEGPTQDAECPCTSECVGEATGLGEAVVADVLDALWRSGYIEAIPMASNDVAPHLVGILRVLPGRRRTWGWDGHYMAHRSDR